MPNHPSKLSRLFVLASLVPLVGCAQAVLGVVLATQGGSGGSGGGSSDGASSPPSAPAQSFSVQVSPPAQPSVGEVVVVQIPAGGPNLLPGGVAPAVVAPGTVVPRATPPLVPNVTVGGAPALDVRVLSGSSFSFRLPENPEGNLSSTLQILITLPGWRSETTIRYAAQVPTLSSISPESVRTVGGESVTIQGTGFVEGMVVDLGGLRLSPSSVTPTTLTFVSPPFGSTAPVDVIAVHPEGLTVRRASWLTPYVAKGPVPSAQISMTGPSGPLRVGEAARWEITVLDPEGEPASGVSFAPGFAGAGLYAPISSLYGATNADGRYSLRFGPLFPGRMRLYAYLTGGLPFLPQGRLELSGDVQVNLWTPLPGGGWQKRAQGLSGAKLRWLTRAPDDPAELYAASDAALYWSNTEGASWQARTFPGGSLRDLCAGVSGTLLAATDGGVRWSPDQGATWQDRSAGLTSLDVRNLARGQGTKLYATTFTGVHVSANEGGSWTPTPSALANGSALTCASGADVVYVAVGGELHRTADGGTTWSRVDSGFDGSSLLALACDADGQLVLAGSTSGRVYRSTDSGGSWSSAQVGEVAAPVRDLAQASSSWLAVTEGQGAFLSTDGAGPWVENNVGLGGRACWAVSAVDESRWALAAGRGGVWVTQEGGTTPNWRPLRGLPTQPLSLQRFYVSPDDPDSLFAAAKDFPLRSSDGGRTWFPAMPRLQNLLQTEFALKWRPGRLYYAGLWVSEDDGGHWRRLPYEERGDKVALWSDPTYPDRLWRVRHYSRDGGLTWKGYPLNIMNGTHTLPASQLFTSSPVLPNRVWSYGGRLQVSQDVGVHWTPDRTVPGLRYLVADAQDADTVHGIGNDYTYLVSRDQGQTWESSVHVSDLQQDQASGRLWSAGGYSDDGGRTWSPWTAGPSESPQYLALRNRRDDSTLYAWTNNDLYRSTDRGGSWDARGPSGFVRPASSTIICSIATPGRLFLFTTSGLKSSDDAGRTWTTRTVPGGRLSSIEVDATLAGRLYGFDSGNIYRSDDAGTNWTLVGSPGVDELFADPNVSQRLYRSVGGALFRSDDGGVAWAAMAVPPNWNRDGADLFLARGHPGLLMAWGALGGKTVYESRDAGLSWSALGTASGLDDPQQLAVDVFDDQVRYATGEGDRRQRLLFLRSLDGGQTWTETSFPVRMNQSQSAPYVLPSPSVPNQVLVASTNHGLLLSDDRGTTWRGASVGAPLGPRVVHWAGQGNHYVTGDGLRYYYTENAGQ